MIPRTILLGALFLLCGVLMARAGDGGAGPPPVGGACAYTQYEGRAQIASVTQRAYPKNDSYEVKFFFYPNRQVSEVFAQTEGKQFLLQTSKGSYPTTSYVQANGIEAGKEFDCILDVIVKGTCTPMIFEFPSFKE